MAVALVRALTSARTMDTRKVRGLRKAIERVRAAAAVIFGSEAAARRYMTTSNFGLGGATPLAMLHQPGGEAAVMNELHAQSESGPL